MIYLVGITIFITVLIVLCNVFIFGQKVSKNKTRIPMLEKKLLWKIPSLLGLVYALLPSFGEKIIQKRKDLIIEQQLLFLLGELSSNLIGGVSTTETITEILNNMEPPLKNKLSLYLVLAKKHGSVKTLEQMINRENNIFTRMFFVMLLNHIKNGGAISESIKKLQKILFLRINLTQRIRAQLLQTKIQIIAGTILPYFMFLVMRFLYKDLVLAVFHSSTGLCMLGLAMLLHIVGVFMFIKICKFNMNKELNGSMLFEYMSFSLKNGNAVIVGIKDAIDTGLINNTVAGSIQIDVSTTEIINLLKESKEPYMKNLSSILKKGYSLGIGISDELSNQALDILEKLEQRAMRFQQVAPAKALVPMLFFIFPATYLMILAPVIVQVFG